MAISEKHFVEMFRKMPEQDQHSTIDFMEYLASRRIKQLQEFYDSLEEVDEPFSEEELRQMKDSEFISWEEACEELGLNDENTTE